MEATIARQKLLEVVQVNNNVSVQHDDIEMTLVNNLLDSISRLKKILNRVIDTFSRLDNLFVELSNTFDADETDLEMIKMFIRDSRQIRKEWISTYIQLNDLKKQNITFSELKDLKIALDVYREQTDDLEDRFFSLKEDEEYTNLVNELSC